MDSTAQLQQSLLEFLERYQGRPDLFAEEIFELQLEPWQRSAMLDVANGVRRISIRSGHGVGKTGFLAMLACWGLVVHPRIVIVATAPSGPQLYDGLFSQVKIYLSRLPELLRDLFEVKADRIERKASSEECYFACRTSRAETPDALQGIHLEGGVVWLLPDESAGIPESVFEAASGSMSGHNCTTICTGNPTRASGFFFDTHHKLAHMWKRYQVSCIGSPRVSPDFVEDMRSRYGEDSNAFRARVLGEFPRSDDDTLISLELVEAAQRRDIATDPKARRFWGLDCARFGDDQSVLCKRHGKVVPEKLKAFPPKMDTMQIVGAVAFEYKSTPANLQPEEILVDVIGIGAGVVDRLRELGLPVRGINVSEASAFDAATYDKLRDDLWGQGKAWLAGLDCRLPDDDNLLELTVPKYKFLSNGKIKVESKDDMKKRKVRSPNFADAFLLTFASEGATAAGSWSASSNWNKPLRRRIKGVI